MRFFCVVDLCVRDYGGTIQPLTAVVTINPFAFVFATAFRANQFWCCGTRRHAADSFFGLLEDVFDVFASLPSDDFSPLVLAGASFLAAS